MKLRFRLYVRRTDQGTYTVTLPGVPKFVPIDGNYDDYPASPRFAAYGPVLEEVKSEIREALELWLPWADPEWIRAASNYWPEQGLDAVRLEFRPANRHGRRREEPISVVLSLIVNPPDADGQRLVIAPAIGDEGLQFYWHPDDDLGIAAAREILAVCADMTPEQLLQFRPVRHEHLDELEVSFTPVTPSAARKKTSDGQEQGADLRQVGTDLTALAADKRLGRTYGRGAEVEELLLALSSKSSPSVLVTGRSECGKSAVIHEVVRRIAAGRCPDELKNRRVYETSPDHLIAGCCYIGQWQERLHSVLETVRKERHILVIRDVAGLLDAGRTDKTDQNMSQFLKPYLADGTVTIIGEATDERRRFLDNRDPSFAAMFRTMEIAEPDRESTLSIIRMVAADLERQHSVRIDPGIFDAIYHLCRRFQPYRAFPGKAVRFLEQLTFDAARQHQSSPQKGARRASARAPVLDRKAATLAFARYTGLPEMILSDHVSLSTASIAEAIGRRVIGQPDAVQAVADLLTVIKAGLNDPDKPLACLMFVGPTGVGKTELAKQIAAYLFGSPDRMIRFDMSEYSEPFTVGKLIGSADGRAEGELTARIRSQPFSLVLLDEFEKADRSIFDIMLQVLGEGRLTDAAGRTADFRSAIVVMTSNLGASSREQRKLGLRPAEGLTAIEGYYRHVVESNFRPEFVNRLDKIVVFRHLDRDAMLRIAEAEVRKLLEREGIARRGITLTLDEDVFELLLDTGFNVEYGARPLKRAIEQRIILPLSRRLAEHPADPHDLVRLRVKDGSVLVDSRTIETTRYRVTGEGERPSVAMSSDEMIDVLGDLRRRLHAWDEGEQMGELRDRLSALLAETRAPGFVDSESQQETWMQAHATDRVIRRVEQLRDRADYLEELAVMCRREHNDAYMGELVASTIELRRNVDYLEIEMLAEINGWEDRVSLEISPVGSHPAHGMMSAWPIKLIGMYAAYAQRKGHAISVAAFDAEAHRRGNKPWKQIETIDRPEGLVAALTEQGHTRTVITVRGSATAALLAGEAGLHKLADDGSGRTQIALVRLSQTEADAEILNLDHMAALDGEDAAPRAKDLPPIVRTYSLHAPRRVSDPRTGQETQDTEAVLAGDIDDFLLAYGRAHFNQSEEGD
ncbi:MAG: AAA domain-containing protein [Chthonomonadales bacterium]|nr:AAA domain-containing protein [Chthonomonadales bacterium]